MLQTLPILQIYPSEFGLQRMKEEEIKGPVELVNNKTEEIHSKSDVSLIIYSTYKHSIKINVFISS